jgi:hypothetical protein
MMPRIGKARFRWKADLDPFPSIRLASEYATAVDVEIEMSPDRDQVLCARRDPVSFSPDPAGRPRKHRGQAHIAMQADVETNARVALIHCRKVDECFPQSDR